MSSRTVVLLRRDVASQYYNRSWDEVIAAAESGVDGVQTAQERVEAGAPLHTWTEQDADGRPVYRYIAPTGWAAHYKQPNSDRCWLHFQNY